MCEQSFEVDVICDIETPELPPDILMGPSVPPIDSESLAEALGEGWNPKKDDALLTAAETVRDAVQRAHRNLVMIKVQNKICLQNWEASLSLDDGVQVIIDEKKCTASFYLPLNMADSLDQMPEVSSDVRHKLDRSQLVAEFCSSEPDSTPSLSILPKSVERIPGLESIAKRSTKYHSDHLLDDHRKNIERRIIQGLQSIGKRDKSKQMLIENLCQKLGPPHAIDFSKHSHVSFFDHSEAHTNPVVLRIQLPNSYPEESPKVSIIELCTPRPKVESLDCDLNVIRRSVHGGKVTAAEDAQRIVIAARKACAAMICRG
eukprot:CAMPEP_0197530910 /NCGR_PEP_ID=MMETSP1318-20131121/33373_1 /TAXON_ID=552666 /ORGANISM="Partenskyella glossopodia, Strain RCC365" /LENGTH=316 /DNA_ID=CAMNT_0043086921 /DNA_START=187 /DNA_END=1137 /DNA_ORIENTATION=-